jgi:hypothetical protein
LDRREADPLAELAGKSGHGRHNLTSGTVIPQKTKPSNHFAPLHTSPIMSKK